MYEFDDCIDNDWRVFLNEFMMPLTNAEEDDDGDPEYIATDPLPADKEELRPVRVSKKELNQLISELLEDQSTLNCDSQMIDFSSMGPPNSSKKPSDASDWTPINKYKRFRSNPSPQNSEKSPKMNPKTFIQAELNTPPRLVGLSPVNTDMPGTSASFLQKPNTKLYAPTLLETPMKVMSINPDQSPILQLQTPQRIGFLTPTLQSPIYVPMTPPSAVPIITSTPCVPVESSHVNNTFGNVTSSPNFNASLLSPTPIQNSPTVFIMNSQNQLEVCRVPDMSTCPSFNSSFNIMNQLYYQNGVLQLPQYQSIVIQVPTLDLLQNKLDLSSLIPNANQNTSINETINSEPEEESSNRDDKNLTDDKKNKQISIRESKWKEFELLNALSPPKELVYEANAVGFTPHQFKLYEKQMRIHCQLLTQNYMQYYANPKLWQEADAVKLKLNSLKKAVRPEVSPFNAQHVTDCIELCDGWERELTPNNEQNKKYMQFLYDEIELEDIKNYVFRGRFHNRFMEYVVSSKAMIYPQLLPEIPFRTLEFVKAEPTNGELRLIAFSLEHSYKAVYNQLNRLNPKKDREPTLGAICRNMQRRLCSFRSANSIMYIVQRFKSYDEMNPIKFYYKFKKAPPLNHNLIDDVDVNTVAAPKNLRRGLLPKAWDKYVFSYERVSCRTFMLIYLN